MITTVTAENFNGFLSFVFFLSVPLTAILGLVIRRLYRRAITRAMMESSGAPEAAFEVPDATRPNGGSVVFDISPLPRRPRYRTGLALRYLLSGLAYCLVLVVVMFVINDIAFLPVRFGVVLASFATAAIVMAAYVAGLRWYLILLFLVFWIWALTAIEPESNTLIGILALPALFLALLVGNPILRTTTLPLFLVAVALVVPLTVSLDILYYAMVAGVLDFLILYLPPMLSAVLYVLLALAVVLTIGIATALFAVRLIARATAGSSEFMMQHDVLWLFQTIWIVGLGWGENGPVVLLYLLAVAAYRIVLRLMRPSGDAADVNLLLRVFGQRRSQTRLARGLLLDWRADGPVMLIGAADLATETLDAPELAAFLNRRLARIFIGTPEDLASACNAGEARHGDGLFPMQDFYCRDNSWRPTVLTLMSRARRVLIDMRGFDPTKKGIQFEIDALAARVPAENITVVVDPDGIEPVQALFAKAWAAAGRSDGTDRITMRVA
ncbi:hypothetical protein RGUI_1326 [Rhodovulum sp. P5]|uniref:hypothetical protein n=1 Tax=Rhodovulum sp. P5 TaxID=1564506 RepID=UPI0009C22060|nr:hypothetical protein [Rhodovulum sp. P5]ARE39467.1 hypothetical protein RGUI_1326 [Rhodovulum sp. P5]